MPRLSPNASFKASPSRQTGIFNGVVIVYIQIALDGNLHAKTAVGGDLIQHVVKEANASIDFAAAFAVQPDFDVNLRFF
ncbi:Uncharacterised protein [Escherichia coli]|uniref:Uncharacterized protein n=1 Tax=Escherichia coli TaxID=562 RepID=A0A2X3KFD2_ECOLX|nr:Uncharacterised protein [Escherichia coli]